MISISHSFFGLYTVDSRMIHDFQSFKGPLNVPFGKPQDPQKADLYGWQSWLGARDRGYVKDVVYEGFRYRKVWMNSQ